MFYYTTINGTLSGWDLSSLTNASYMFASGTYDNSGAIINSSLVGLDFSGITNMNYMFRDATIDQDIS